MPTHVTDSLIFRDFYSTDAMRAIFDDHHLERVAERFNGLDDSDMHPADAVLLVVERHDDRKLGLSRH